MALGTNAGTFNYFTYQKGPVNLFKYADPWNNAAGTTALAISALDANGWPQTDFTSGGLQYPQNVSTTVVQTLTFNGKASSVSWGFGTTGTIAFVSYNSGTNLSTYTVTWPANATLNYIIFGGTQRTSGSATNTGLTNLDLRDAAYVGSTNMWTSEYKAYLASAFLRAFARWT